MRSTKNFITEITLTAAMLLAAGSAFAADTGAPETVAPPRASETSSAPSKDAKERNFYEVLEDVLSDFEFDLKNGNVNGLKNLSIRNVAMSENIPPSFRAHLELLVTERILKTSKTKVIQCLPCRSKKTAVNGDQVVITSAENNPLEMSRIAKSSGIDNYMDIAFTYQPNGIVLSMTTSDPETGSIIWSRSYNSEASRAAAFRRGVDYSQLDDARKQTEYTPTIQYRLATYYLFEPDGTGTTGTLGLGLRMMERYDNRKKEVGFELDYLKDATTLVGSGAANPNVVALYGSFNLTLLFTHAWNMIGEEENYNRVRGSFSLGIGGTYASGYLGGLARAQYEWRLGKHYAVTTNLGYRPQSTAFLNNAAAGTISGVEYGIGINMLF